jgi:hypothetical protein
MAVVSMMRIPGDADELAAKLREHVWSVAEELAPTHGGLAAIVARDENGLLMINLWESEEGRHAMAAEPAVQEGLRAAGFPEPSFEGHEVLAMRFTDKAVAAGSG